MIRIIRYGEQINPQEHTCRECGTTFEFIDMDLSTINSMDGHSRFEAVVCPVCGVVCSIRRVEE